MKKLNRDWFEKKKWKIKPVHSKALRIYFSSCKYTSAKMHCGFANSVLLPSFLVWYIRSCWIELMSFLKCVMEFWKQWLNWFKQAIIYCQSTRLWTARASTSSPCSILKLGYVLRNLFIFKFSMGVYRMRYWLHQMSNIWLWLISMNFCFCWFLAISADYRARNRQEMNAKLKSAWFGNHLTKMFENNFAWLFL